MCLRFAKVANFPKSPSDFRFAFAAPHSRNMHPTLRHIPEETPFLRRLFWRDGTGRGSARLIPDGGSDGTGNNGGKTDIIVPQLAA